MLFIESAQKLMLPVEDFQLGRLWMTSLPSTRVLELSGVVVEFGGMTPY